MAHMEELKVQAAGWAISQLQAGEVVDWVAAYLLSGQPVYERIALDAIQDAAAGRWPFNNR